MPLVEHIRLGKGVALGVKVDLPKAPLVMVRADRGFAMCGYLNMDSVNKAGEVAVRVIGVRTFEDLLDARVANVSDEARKLGITEGMTAREALERMFQG
ncbi:MAG: DUF1805 domain-containing protein [Euryarchaeota archaeon]|nr:DUF1805 domain-containing protein [Euryarchaeota archaeon]